MKLLSFFKPSRDDLINLAIARAARLAGEAREADRRCNAYATLMEKYDPMVDWWGYATVRQSWHDAREDRRELDRQHAQAEEQLQALLA